LLRAWKTNFDYELRELHKREKGSAESVTVWLSAGLQTKERKTGKVSK